MANAGARIPSHNAKLAALLPSVRESKDESRPAKFDSQTAPI